MICSFFFLTSTRKICGVRDYGAAGSASTIRTTAACLICSSLGSVPPLSCLALAIWLSGLRAMTRSVVNCSRVLPPESSGHLFDHPPAYLPTDPGHRAARDEITSGSVLPRLTACRSFSKLTVGFLSMGRESVLSSSQTPTQSTMMKWSLTRASGVTDCRSSCC